MKLKNISIITPIHSYGNPYLVKEQIYKNKGGIYLWTNTISGKSSVGSAVNLPRRLSNYFSNPRIISVACL